MRPNEPMVREIARNLDEAIHRLNQDLERVEIWTAALSAFLEPVPGYESAHEEFLLPGNGSGGETPPRERHDGALRGSRSGASRG
jgi:hypothetical protein